jgi:hypothetical protein
VFRAERELGTLVLEADPVVVSDVEVGGDLGGWGVLMGSSARCETVDFRETGVEVS